MGLDVEAEDMRKEEADIGFDYNDFGKYFKGYKPEGIMTGNHFTKNGYRDALSKKLLKLCNNKDCAQALGCASSAISCCCRGYAKQHHGYHFAFADQED